MFYASIFGTLYIYNLYGNRMLTLILSFNCALKLSLSDMSLITLVAFEFLLGTSFFPHSVYVVV